MKEIRVPTPSADLIDLDDVPREALIIAMQNDTIRGIVFQSNHDKRWAVMIGGHFSATGWHNTRLACLMSAIGYGYRFFIEE